MGMTFIGYALLLAGKLIIAPLGGHAIGYSYADMIARPFAVRPANVAHDDPLMQAGSRRKVHVNPNDAREGHLRKVRNLTTGFR